MRKISLIIILFLLIFQYGRSQGCDRVIANDIYDINLLASSYIPDSITPIVTIKVNVNVWRENDGTGSYWLDTPAFRDSLRMLFNYLNYQFAVNQIYSDPVSNAEFILDTKVRFELDTVYYYNDSTLAHSFGSTPFILYMIANYPERLNNFNYHLSLNEGIIGSTVAGSSSGYNSINQSITSIRQYNQQNLWSFAIHMKHEFGHNFGLEHTYSGEVTLINSPEFLWDIFGTQTQSWCNNQPSTNVCYHDKGWECDPYDSTNTCTNAVMGGTKDEGHFSALQCGRLHRALRVSTLRKYAYGYSSIPLIISNNQMWDYNGKFYQDIIVDSGATLTISCTIEMVQNAKITIKPGGKLVLDGGVLTNAYVDSTWQGIRVLGNSSAGQLTLGAQGIVELKNGAVISNAVCGIKVWDGTDPNSSGGIVRAANASFINNATAVEFGEYHNINNGYELGNRSYFTNCIFTINNDYLTSNERFQAHVKLNSIKNVRFAGCTFSNERNILPSITAERAVANMGILAFNSGFSVKPSCNVSGVYPCPPEQQNRSSFNGFSHGIYVSGSEGNYTVNIDQTDFDNNVIGINLSATTNVSVLRSQFNIGYADFLPKQTGIIASNSTGFRFEENQFMGNTEFLGTSVGIKIRNSGGNSNQTYKNDFSNLTIGEEFIGKNRSKRDLFIGLQALCNNHTDITQSDILVEMNQNGTRDGIRYYQGERDEGTMLYILSAGNLFSNSATTNYDNNTMQYIDYQYSANDPREMPTVNNMVNLDFPAVSNSCLSRIDALTLSQISQQYSAARNSYISLLYNYNQQIDGGNTEQLLDDIQGEWSDDVWKIRQELLAKSPYVSQEVLKETAKKNLLPQAIYLEICLANVDATRSESFLKFLRYEIPNPLPEYMLDVVRENWDTKSLRTVLESNLAHYSSKKDYLLDMMLNNSLKDSITNRTYVRSMLTERGYYSDYFTIAEGYIEENDFENAYNTMYDLSLNYYKLTEDQQNEINDFEEYIAFRENLFALDNSNIYQLTASEIAKLVDYTQTHTGRGRILAQNILCVLYDICEEEELIENKDHFTPNSNTYSSGKITSDQIEVMPNPAQNYTTFKWDFDLLQGNALLKIYEQSGKQIETQVLSSAQGQWVWDTREVSDGIYTYSVTTNSMLIGSGKVIVKK